MEKYLIELLETNNRVIVPDLGAFIIRQQEPRELVFNDLLAFNDGMLTSHIKQQEGLSMSKSQVKIEEFVDHVKKVLTKGDIFHLEDLGYLKMDDSSKIEFSVTRFPTSKEVITSASISQPETVEESTEPVPEPADEETTEVPTAWEGTSAEIPPEETPSEEVAEEEVPIEETLTVELADEEIPIEETSSEEVTKEEVPIEETPSEEVAEEEAPIEEILTVELANEEAPIEETPSEEVAEEEVPIEETPSEEVAAEEEPPKEASEEGIFTLDDQTGEIDVDASEYAPLKPDAEEPPEEPPFVIEEQKKQEQSAETSQARLEAAAAAASVQEEKESESSAEASAFVYGTGEREIRRAWPWIVGAAAFLIILLVAAWFFFPDKVNRILTRQTPETTTVEEPARDDVASPGQEIATGTEDQGEITQESVTPGDEPEEITEQETEAVTDTPAGKTPQETEVETAPETETPPATQTRKYYIVAGMFSSKANAESYVNTLKSKGYGAELFGRKNNLHAVSFSSHESKAAAIEEMNRIREQYDQKAWLLYY